MIIGYKIIIVDTIYDTMYNIRGRIVNGKVG